MGRIEDLGGFYGVIEWGIMINLVFWVFYFIFAVMWFVYWVL